MQTLGGDLILQGGESRFEGKSIPGRGGSFGPLPPELPYFHVIRHISLRSTYSLASAPF